MQTPSLMLQTHGPHPKPAPVMAVFYPCDVRYDGFQSDPINPLSARAFAESLLHEDEETARTSLQAAGAGALVGRMEKSGFVDGDAKPAPKSRFRQSCFR